MLLVYIKEAHALDGRAAMPGPGLAMVEEPETDEERSAIATRCFASTGLEAIPAVVDGIDDRVAGLYAAAPDRLYVVDAEGHVAYRGGRGPFGFSVDEAEEALRSLLP